MYKINENYFEKIDSKNKAYWIGFISADGNVYKNKLSIELNNKDDELLKQFITDLETPRPLYYRERKNGTKSVTVEIRNNKIVEDLRKYNIIPKKTYNLCFPNIDKKYYKDYIRGFFDGDGTYVLQKKSRFIKSKGKYENKTYCEIACVCKCKDFLLNISNILLDNNINNHLYYSKRDDLYYIRIYGISNCKNFINYIYYDDCRMLLRKKEKALEIVNIASHNSNIML